MAFRYGATRSWSASSAATSKPSGEQHSIDWDRPAEHALARSLEGLEGGVTWTLEEPETLKPLNGVKVAGVLTEPGGKPSVDCPSGIDFTHPGFALSARMEDVNIGPSRFYYSYDRGKTWIGRFKIPNFGQKGIAARVDYLVNGRRLPAGQRGSFSGPESSFLSVNAKNVQLVTLKQSEQPGRGWIARLVETAGHSAEVDLRLPEFPATGAMECDLVENDIRPLPVTGGVAQPNRTRCMLGLVLPDIASRFFSEVAEAIEYAASISARWECGYRTRFRWSASTTCDSPLIYLSR